MSRKTKFQISIHFDQEGEMSPQNKNHSKVLFQKLGSKWYAFTEGQEGLLCTALPEGLDPRNQKFEFYEILEENLERPSSKKFTKKRTSENFAAS